MGGMSYVPMCQFTDVPINVIMGGCENKERYSVFFSAKCQVSKYKFFRTLIKHHTIYNLPLSSPLSKRDALARNIR